MFTYLQVRRSSLTLLAAAAVALPAGAQARPIFDPPSGGQIGHRDQPAPPVNAAAQPELTGATGFQWDDAGIGAAGAIVLLGVSAGTATAIRRRRRDRVATA
ncbi:MAG TPA: hypothetical protein VH279_14685 [Solirubrobacteraceae bacterium]|jgi:hypothetical protein|nr:hypothetical protein [Solirubrobacteraceae bacterium]